MRVITGEDLDKIIQDHQHWVNQDCDGWENMKADLSYTDLSGMCLRCVNLCYADLSHSILNHVDFCGADLHNADLSFTMLCYSDLQKTNMDKANLSYAYLNNACLSSATLIEANLSYSVLCESNLNCTDMNRANLRNAYLYKANLNSANLSKACLYRTNLNSADMRYAILIDVDANTVNLQDANLAHSLPPIKNLPFVPLACPDSGDFIGWKKAHNKIIKLLIPADAKRLSATGRKCRCDKADVLAIENLDGSPTILMGIPSDYDKNFMYYIGKTVSVDNFCEDRWIECAAGIHFFINRQEAVDY